MNALSNLKILAATLWLVFQLTPHTTEAQTRLRDVARRDASTDWIYFNPGTRIAPEAFFSTFQSDFGMTAADHFKLIRSWTDELGMTHHLFHQYHEGIKVEHATMLLHEQNGELSTAHGYMAPGIIMSSRPSVDVDQALQKSLDAVDATAYAWEDESIETTLRANTKSPDTSWYPQPELRYVQIDRSKGFSPENMTLGYRTPVYSTEPMDMNDVYVDAHSGQVLYLQSQKIECVPTTGVTNYYGTKTLHVGEYPGGGYHLYDNCSGNGIHTRPSNLAPEFWSPTPIFGASTNTNANSAHWCTRTTFDYFNSQHGRSSPDNAGSWWQNRVGGFGANAFWTGWLGYVTIWDGDGGNLSNSLATLDVLGHEWTHAITQFNGTGGLNYNYESGALNESFSDIFGTMVEFFAPGGGEGDYFIGDDCWVPDGMLRNMQNPKQKGQPDTYRGEYWFTASDDNGGVHYNSGVPNHWFYLLAEGSDGANSDRINDNGDVFTVSGIGRGDASRIAYRTLTTYLSPSANFYNARLGSIQAAKDLFGPNSHQACQVANAWYAVGVGKDNLMMRDAPYDYGMEPFVPLSANDLYIATDIWFRNTPDRLNSITGRYFEEHRNQAAIASEIVYVYVKIRNIGNVASQCGKLKMYWGRQSLGLTWPLHMTQFTACSDTAPVDYDIPSIPARGDYTVQITWCTPDPSLLPGTGIPAVVDSHFCVLARVVRDNDPMHDERNGDACHSNMLRNNNIALTNLYIVHSNGVHPSIPLPPTYVRTRHLFPGTGPVGYIITDDDKNPFRTKGDILVQLSDPLFILWTQGGMKGTGFEQVGGGKTFKLTAPEASIEGIDLPMGEDFSIGLSFDPFEGQPIVDPGIYKATIAQIEYNAVSGQNENVGGVVFELHVNPYPIWAGDDVTMCKGDSIMLTADLSNWKQNSSTVVTWNNGQTGSSIIIGPDVTSIYKVKVTNDDGSFAEDDVLVIVKSPVAWYQDADADGFGSNSVTYSCEAPGGYVDNYLDCSDYNNGIHPGAIEICNGVDDNCDGQIDEGLGFVLYWRDLDGDGFGDSQYPLSACIALLGYSSNKTDCDDQNPAINPNAKEVCNDLDDDCNGQIDDGCVPTSVTSAARTKSIIHINPNPNSGTFIVELPEAATPRISFRITDLTGRLLLEKQTVAGNRLQEVQAANLSAGLYFLQVVSEGKVVAAGKFVKQ